jgi:glycosyltransferase involved in cell wall biosynthesis
MARRLLFYTHAFGGGGAETVFARLAMAFAQNGDTIIFAADCPGPEPVRDAPGLRHHLLRGNHIETTRALAALLASEQPDASFSALGAHNLKHLAAASLAGRRRRCILGYHGFAEAEPKLLSRLSYWATPVTTRLAARTICVSDVLRENICQRWHAAPQTTIRIYNPIPAYKDRVATPDPTAPLVLAVGRLAPVKRYPDLVKAFASVEPNTAHLAIVGEGPDRAAIEAAIEATGLQQRVTLPGHVQDPSPWYRRASCLVISSQSESFGLTAAEALAFGVPVVATACGGPAEILDQGRFGRLVAIGDIKAMADAISRSLAQPGDPEERRHRAEMFSLETIHRAYADLIDSLR